MICSTSSAHFHALNLSLESLYPSCVLTKFNGKTGEYLVLLLQDVTRLIQTLKNKKMLLGIELTLKQRQMQKWYFE